MARAGRSLDDHGPEFLTTFGALLSGVGGGAMNVAHTWPWTILGFGAVSSLLGTALYVRRDRELTALRTENLELKARTPQHVFFAAAALSDDWQIELQHSLFSELRRRGIVPESWSPNKNDSFAEQDDILAEILRQKDRYIGGLLIPVEPNRNHERFHAFVEELGKPVVFVDRFPAKCVRDRPRNCTFVGVDSASGGRLAARAALELAADRPIRRILVIASTNQSIRQEEFARVLKKERPDISLVVDTDGQFNRAAGQEVTLRHLRQADRIHEQIDLIFCTNDAMALGCVDALERSELQTDAFFPLIIGYDGIPAAKHIVTEGKGPLIRLVAQDAHEVAVAAVHSLTELMENASSFVPMKTISPVLYPAVNPNLSVRSSRV